MDATDTLPTVTLADHAHHWVIGEPDGPLSAGYCKRCGAKRDFRNWIAEIDFITTNEERRAA